MIFWRIVALGCLLTAIAASGRAQDGRFSTPLTASARTAAGLERLAADQLAVLDALVRRDEKINAKPDTAHPVPVRFSQRLSPEERASAGLDSLSAAELAQLDALVPPPASGRVSSLTSKAAGPAVQPEPSAPAPEIHGMISFTFGGGRGGYREKGGFMMLDYQDPAHGLELLVGYGETQISGPSLGRGFFRRSPR
jgi:hypothetical protein